MSTLHNHRQPFETEIYLSFPGGPSRIAWSALHSDETLLQQTLEKNYKQAATCLCQSISPQKLSIRKRGQKYHLARFPHTAHLHKSTCELYIEPDSLSGRQGYEEGVVQKDLDGATRLKFEFDLYLTDATNKAPLLWSTHYQARSSTPGKSVTLLGLMHEIWDQAGFNRWHPHMAGKRPYSVVYKYCQSAIANITGAGRALSDILYMPQPFQAARLRELLHERDTFYKKFTRKGASTLRFIAMGEVKSIEEHEAGWKLTLRHDLRPYYLSEEIKNDTARRFQRELNATIMSESPDDSRLIAIMLVHPTRNLHATVMGISLMRVTDTYIPVDSQYEKLLADHLIGLYRVFKKPLRFDASKMDVFPDFLLLDTDPITVIEVFGFQGSGEYEARKLKKIHFYRQTPYGFWCWEPQQYSDPLPVLPTATL